MPSVSARHFAPIVPGATDSVAVGPGSPWRQEEIPPPGPFPPVRPGPDPDPDPGPGPEPDPEPEDAVGRPAR